jgi:hypothetical protein
VPPRDGGARPVTPRHYRGHAVHRHRPQLPLAVARVRTERHRRGREVAGGCIPTKRGAHSHGDPAFPGGPLFAASALVSRRAPLRRGRAMPCPGPNESPSSRPVAKWRRHTGCRTRPGGVTLRRRTPLRPALTCQ